MHNGRDGVCDFRSYSASGKTCCLVLDTHRCHSSRLVTMLTTMCHSSCLLPYYVSNTYTCDTHHESPSSTVKPSFSTKRMAAASRRSLPIQVFRECIKELPPIAISSEHKFLCKRMGVANNCAQALWCVMLIRYSKRNYGQYPIQGGLGEKYRAWWKLGHTDENKEREMDIYDTIELLYRGGCIIL